MQMRMDFSQLFLKPPLSQVLSPDHDFSFSNTDPKTTLLFFTDMAFSKLTSWFIVPQTVLICTRRLRIHKKQRREEKTNGRTEERVGEFTTPILSCRSLVQIYASDPGGWELFLFMCQLLAQSLLPHRCQTFFLLLSQTTLLLAFMNYDICVTDIFSRALVS